MKKVLFIVLAVLPILFSSCEKDSPKFDYDMNLLYGKWRVTSIYIDGSYFDITTYSAQSVFGKTYAMFNSNGTYSGEGYFGNGSGTYSAEGKTVTTFISGKEYLKYQVVSLTGTNAELIMSETSSSETTKIKVQKQ